MKAREIIDYLYAAHPSLRDAEMAELLARAESAEAALAQCRHERDTLANRLEQAEAALAALQTPCVWTPEKDVWGDDYADDGFRTQCGAWYLSRAIKDGHFCPNCGHPVEVAP